MANTDKGLQIWMPMTKDLHNLGLAQVSFTNNGATYSSTGGKLGGCYAASNHTSRLISDKKVDLGSNLTFCAWFKFTSLTSSSSLGGTIVSQHEYQKNAGLGITLKYVSSTTGYISCNTGNGSGRTYNTYCGNTLLQANTWYHVAMTYTGGTVTFYINGVQDGQHSVGTMSVPSNYIVIGNWAIDSNSYGLYGLINDVRIYSYSLSPLEIKELAKGMVGHWLGEGNGTFLPNILNTSSMAIDGWYGMTPVKNSIGGIDINFSNDGTHTSGTARISNIGCNGYAGPWVVSFDIVASKSLTLSPLLCDIGLSCGSIAVATTKKHVVGYATASNYYQSNNYNGFLDFEGTTGTTNAGAKVTISNIKVERGTVASAYNVSSQAFLSDISGLERHASITGNITLSDTTPRYDKCLLFSDRSSKISTDYRPINLPEHTVSLWFKVDDTSNRQVIYSNYAGDNSGSFIEVEVMGGGLRIHYSDQNKYTISWSPYTVSAGTWHYLAVTYKNHIFDVYYDNNHTSNTYSTFSNVSSTNDYLWFGLMGNSTGIGFKGCLSDIRIYHTCLDSTVIAELKALGH